MAKKNSVLSWQEQERLDEKKEEKQKELMLEALFSKDEDGEEVDVWALRRALKKQSTHVIAAIVSAWDQPAELMERMLARQEKVFKEQFQHAKKYDEKGLPRRPKPKAKPKAKGFTSNGYAAAAKRSKRAPGFKAAQVANKRKRVPAKHPGQAFSYEPITPGEQARIASSNAGNTGSVNGGSKEKLEAVDKAVLKLGGIRPFVIGDAIRAVSVEVGNEHDVTRGVIAASIKRLLKSKELSKSGTGKNLSYRTKQLEPPATNGAAAHA